MASNITSTTEGVAAGDTFPVDVLMKSAPAFIAISLAKRTLSKVTNSPVSKITFKWAFPQASLTDAISSATYVYSPRRNFPLEMTISTSSAPSATTILTSFNLYSRDAIPLGKAVATEATFISVFSSAFFAMATIVG